MGLGSALPDVKMPPLVYLKKFAVTARVVKQRRFTQLKMNMLVKTDKPYSKYVITNCFVKRYSQQPPNTMFFELA